MICPRSLSYTWEDPDSGRSLPGPRAHEENRDALWSPGPWWREGVHGPGVGTGEAGLGPQCLVPGGGT